MNKRSRKPKRQRKEEVSQDPGFVIMIAKHVNVHEVVSSAFSFSAGFSRMTASWLVILRPSARSTLAPRASLLRLSDFSALGTNRCFASGLFSRRFSPSRRLLYSVYLGSPLGRLPVVSSEAIEGLPLTVENRFEARFYSTGLDCRLMETLESGSGLTDWVMMGRSESREGCLAMSVRANFKWTLGSGAGGAVLSQPIYVRRRSMISNARR